MSIEAMKQAVDALEYGGHMTFAGLRKAEIAAEALRTAIEQAEKAGPVAWQHHARKLTQWLHCMSYNDSYFGEPAGLVKQVTGELNRLIGAAPPQRQPLTKQEVLDIVKAAPALDTAEAEWLHVARAIERKHGIGGDK